MPLTDQELTGSFINIVWDTIEVEEVERWFGHQFVVPIRPSWVEVPFRASLRHAG